MPELRPLRNGKSCPIQDEPEGEVGFQYKMSLERVASWRIDNQRARSRETQSGSDPGFSTSQPNHPIRGRKPTPGLPLDRTGACLLYTSPSPRDGLLSRMPSSA